MDDEDCRAEYEAMENNKVWRPKNRIKRRQDSDSGAELEADEAGSTDSINRRKRQDETEESSETP